MGPLADANRPAACPPGRRADQRPGVPGRPSTDAPVPTGDLDPVSRRARLSYRRAAALFHQTTGWTLHQLRHSALTHEAEDGTNTPMLLARSRHASVRSLERYARPSAEAVARHVASRDPAARRPPGP
jgi:integrase